MSYEGKHLQYCENKQCFLNLFKPVLFFPSRETNFAPEERMG